MGSSWLNLISIKRKETLLLSCPQSSHSCLSLFTVFCTSPSFSLAGMWCCQPQASSRTCFHGLSKFLCHDLPIPEPHTLHLSTRGSPFMGMNALCSWSFMSLHNMISLLLSRFFCLFVLFLVCFFKECGFLPSSDTWTHQEDQKTKLLLFTPNRPEIQRISEVEWLRCP